VSRFRKNIRIAHLWLGLISGLLVFIIAITGCLYAFQEEIQNLTQPYRFVENEHREFLPPSKIVTIATAALPGKHLHAVMYHDSVHAAKAIFYSYEEEYYWMVYINQYTGEVLQVKDMYSGFFAFVLDGHFYLWLPPDIGQPVVASASLVFFAMLVSGIVLWWPRNRYAVRKKFQVRFNARWRRTNYDLHSVLGFYASWFAIILVITGLVWGFNWFRDGLFSAVSGGENYVEYYDPPSDTTRTATTTQPAIDEVWQRMIREYPDAKSIEVHPPETPLSSIAANANPEAGTYWKTDYRYFDQYTLEERGVDHVWNRFDEASNAELLFRMNYDIHTGAILGLTGKIFACFISLMVASLPVTGVLLWIGKRKKQRSQAQTALRESAPGLA
jgi:uncharacterized iron-regulated membrane protein